MINNAMRKVCLDLASGQLEAFLKNENWTRDYFEHGKYSIWHQSDKNGNVSEIVIPLNKEYKDYNDVIIRNIERLLSHYDIAFDKLIHKIRQETKDLVKIRIINDDVKDGMIPLDDGVKLIESAKELMSASALSVISKKRVYLGKLPDIANKYMGNLKLGQTETGSYIINIYSVIEREETPELFDLAPYSRKVTKQLIESIETIKLAIRKYKRNQNIEVFDESVDKGVSANLCNSILKLSGANSNRNIVFNVNIENDLTKFDNKYECSIKNEDMPILKKAYEYLLDKNYFEDFELEGFVVKLVRDELSQSGEITVSTILFDKQRLVRANLTASQYDIAIAAHKNQSMIYIEGDLSIESRKAEIMNIKNIKRG